MTRYRLMTRIVIGSLALGGIATHAYSQAAPGTWGPPQAPQMTEGPGDASGPVCPYCGSAGVRRGPMGRGGPPAFDMERGQRGPGRGGRWGRSDGDVDKGFRGREFGRGQGRGQGRWFGHAEQGRGPGMRGPMGRGFGAGPFAVADDKFERSTEKTDTGVVMMLTTEDPQLVAVIQAHAQAREERSDEARPHPLWDPLFADLYLHQGDIAHRVELTEDGVRVVAEGSTPEAIALIHAHADLRAAVEEYGRSALAKPHDSPIRGE